MDGDSSELFNITQAFYSGDYKEVLAIDVSQLSLASKVNAQVLVERSKIALGRSAEVIEELASSTEPALKIVKHYAEFTLGRKDVALKGLAEEVTQHHNDPTVKFVGGLLLILNQKFDEALQLLSTHEGSLECVQLIVYIYLVQNKVDLAVKQVMAAKKWAQDSIIYNIAEAWTNLRSKKSQDAFYIYEELGVASSASVQGLIGQGVSQLQLLRFEEAGEAFKDALAVDGENANALADAIALYISTSKDYEELQSKLELCKDHPSLVDLHEKSLEFDKIAEKYAKA